MKHSNIHYSDPQTLELMYMLRCAPTNAPNNLKDITADALAKVRFRFGFLHKVRFPLFYLDETLMSYRLVHLIVSFLKENPTASNEDILLYLIGDEKNPPHYMLSVEEERALIGAYQEHIPGSAEMALTFLAPKIIATIKPLMFGINKKNCSDIEAVCLASLDRLLQTFDLENTTIGLPQNLVSLELSNDILEEFGQNYTITIHRRQINNLRRLHAFMHDDAFADLSQEERAEEAGIPLDIVILYDSLHTAGSEKMYYGIPVYTPITETYPDSTDLTAIPSLALSIVEEKYDATLAEKDELFIALAEVVVRWITKHNKRPSVAGKKILRDFSEIKVQRNIPDEDFDRYVQEILAWMKVYAHRLMP